MYGMSCYGDNIEDEWFIVYLILELTKRMPNLIAQIVDNDGEFLLIEAADSLPSWANPSSCINRVFISKGKLHIIPPNSSNPDEEISINDAISKIALNSDSYVAKNEIFNHVKERIVEYPDKIRDMMHQTTVYTPVGVAALLKEDPNLISAAVHAFCNRDPIDMKVCRAMKYFPPENRVNTSVKFTKCLYAMLTHNSFTADRRTGWNLPPPNSPQYKSHSLGVKLACGFEILVSQAKPNQPLESNKAWDTYLNGLKTRNYFQGLLEHSQQYNVLLENAKDYFINHLDYVKMTPIVGKRILDMLSDLNLDERVFRKEEPLLPDDDDDKWLLIDPKDLENLLQNRYGQKNFVSLTSETNPINFSGKLNEFLEQTSGIEGVDLQESEENLPTRPKRGIKVKRNSKESSNSASSRSPSLTRKYKVDFDPDQFSNAVQNILDLVIPDDNWNLESESDFSNYGSDDDLAADVYDLNPSQPKKSESTMKNYMKEMDSQLSETTLAKSFATTNKDGNTSVDVNTNVLKNMMQSYQEEAGGSGPAGNILEPLGFTKFEHFNSIDDEVD
ncbi:ecdysoneless cell cycle regulator isoform X2 [Arctopsyche grandis]